MVSLGSERRRCHMCICIKLVATYAHYSLHGIHTQHAKRFALFFFVLLLLHETLIMSFSFSPFIFFFRNRSDSLSSLSSNVSFFSCPSLGTAPLFPHERSLFFLCCSPARFSSRTHRVIDIYFIDSARLKRTL